MAAIAISVPTHESEQAASPHQAALKVVATFLLVGWQQANHAHVEAEVRQTAKNQHPGPHRDVDAIFEAAHPAGENDLRQIDDRRTGDANGKCDDGVALDAGATAAAGQHRARRSEHLARNIERAGRRAMGDHIGR